VRECGWERKGSDEVAVPSGFVLLIVKMNMKKNKTENKWLFINQTWLVGNVPFFLFLSALAVVYIYNGHHAEKAIKDINKTARELKELQYEYKMLRSDWMFMTKQSEVVKAVSPNGLKEILEPPLMIVEPIQQKKQP
jgi:cell division protein FtsL